MAIAYLWFTVDSASKCDESMSSRLDQSRGRRGLERKTAVTRPSSSLDCFLGNFFESGRNEGHFPFERGKGFA